MALTTASAQTVVLPLPLASVSCPHRGHVDQLSWGKRILFRTRPQRLAAARAAGTEDGPAEEGRNREALWRKELTGLDGAGKLDTDLDSDLQQDIERLNQRRQAEKRLESYRYGPNQARSQETEEVKKSGFPDVVDKLLVLDFFFILFILAWFLAGLGEQAALHSSALFDAWLSLWTPVFQPALGVFMAGALASAISSWSAKRQQ